LDTFQKLISGLIFGILRNEFALHSQVQNEPAQSRHRIRRVGEVVELFKEGFQGHDVAFFRTVG